MTTIIYSCKRELIKPDDSELIRNAELWFNAQSRTFYTPNWDRAVVTHLDNKNFIILPSNISVSEASTSVKSFLIIDISNEKTKGNVVELINYENINKMNHNDVITNYLVHKNNSIYPIDLKVNLLSFDIYHRYEEGSAFVG
ncbi:hypothetical protein [Pedobacter sp. Leaf170]|uniref:hypothetical protein n=1 Tax=Pedobacter sp. Leaf170 TaxID=2876558 RepID=UPI001E393AC7|nr:hypothetical protein [Pedobacter sp. Leaf170]